MITRIVDINTPESVKTSCFNKVRHFLYDLNCDYPFFEEWLEHVFVMTYTEERTIITCESDDNMDIYGVCIIKNNEEEKKICTLRVATEMQRRGIGTHLVSIAITLLGDEYPLITVPQKHLYPYERFLSFFNFKISDKVKSVYNEDTYEYYFNKPYLRENVLMSVKPEYADKIIKGVKKVEFRKTCFSNQVKRVYIYSSHPVKRIMGYFTVEKIIKQSPQLLWDKYHLTGGIDQTKFFRYFEKRDKGNAIIIREVFPYRYGLSLQDVFGNNYSIPQNYRYIDNVRILHKLNLLVDNHGQY